jgi:hypothetical protein
MIYLIFGAKARLNFRAWQKYISGSMRTKGEEHPTRRAAIPARMLRTHRGERPLQGLWICKNTQPGLA